MAEKKSGAVKPAPLPKKFNPKDLTIEQQEAVIEYYLGYHPRYFLYDGLQIKMNVGRFEADERSQQAKNPKYGRRWFNGWNPKPRNMRIKNMKERDGR